MAREQGVCKHTIYAWKSKYGGMEVSELTNSARAITDAYDYDAFGQDSETVRAQ